MVLSVVITPFSVNRGVFVCTVGIIHPDGNRNVCQKSFRTGPHMHEKACIFIYFLFLPHHRNKVGGKSATTIQHVGVFVALPAKSDGQKKITGSSLC